MDAVELVHALRALTAQIGTLSKTLADHAELLARNTAATEELARQLAEAIAMGREQ